MPNPVSTSDLANRWRPLTAQETVNANAFLGDAWSLLLTRRPTLETDMAAGTVTTASVIRVISAMVLRVLRNPDGKKSEGLDDYTFTRDDRMASGLLHVTPEELADVTPGRRGPRSVRLVIYGES